MNLYNKLEVNLIMENLVEKLRWFRTEYAQKEEEKKEEQQNTKDWYPPHDIFRIEGDLAAAVSYNKCDSEWCVIATSGGLREISIDCSLRSRARSADGTTLCDSEYDNYTDCLVRFCDIESPKHTEIFGVCPFGGRGDKKGIADHIQSRLHHMMMAIKSMKMRSHTPFVHCCHEFN
eukprot:229476_1